MPVPTDITAGTISISGSTVTGVGTSFVASDIRQGDLFIWIEGGAGEWSPIVQTVTSNTVLTLAEPWTGPTVSGARYRLRYQWDSSRVSAQSRQLIEMLDNGNVLALAGLTGPGVPVFDGPHSMTVRPETDFINGVAYNVQVDTLADRAAYDGQAAGYSVLVSDVGDGRSAVYSKASNASGDWTDPAYVTGPIGPASTVPGIVWRGPYSGSTPYVANDGVLDNGSSWRAKTSTTDNAPPVLPTTSNAWWELIAAKGSDGTGTGDVVGPTGGTADNGFVLFADTTGKLIKTVTPEAYTALINPFGGDSGSGGIKGLVPAPANGDAAAEKFLNAGGTWVSIILGEMKNKIINPRLTINQLGVSGTVTLSAGNYGHDGFKAGASGCTYTFSTASNGVTTLNISAGSLQQIVEAAAIDPGNYVLSWSGTSQARINAGGYGVTGAVGAVLDGTSNVTVEWNTGTLAMPQLERGRVTPFSSRHPAIEHLICERYIQVLGALVAAGFNTTTALAGAEFRTVMRATPTATLVTAGNLIGNGLATPPTSIALQSANSSNTSIDFISSGITASASYVWRGGRIILRATL